MKKALLFLILFTVMLSLCLPASAMDTQGTLSVQQLFAQLQSNRSQMDELLGELTDLQAKQNELGDILLQVNDHRANKTELLPKELAEKIGLYLPNFAETLSLPIDDGGYSSLILALDKKQAEVATQVQECMAKIQNGMSDYNSHLQTTLSQLQTPSGGFASPSQTGTMLGEGIGMSFTFGVIGAALGVLGTLLATRRKSKDNKKK